MFRVSAEQRIFHLSAEYLLQFLNVSSLTTAAQCESAFDANKSWN